VYRSSASYIGSETARATVTTSEDFRRIYAAFGYDEARAEDGDSLSYVYDLNATTRVLMLDCNTMHDPCGLSDETLAWIERQLKEARRDGAAILAAEHQNLYKHSFFGFGYVLMEGEELAALLRKYDVPLFLSGHLHIQHILTEDGLTEITTSPLTMGVCRYALLEAQQGAMSYETRPVDVAAWAAQKGSTDERLLRFAESSYETMAARMRVNVAEQFAGELAAEFVIGQDDIHVSDVLLQLIDLFGGIGKVVQLCHGIEAGREIGEDVEDVLSGIFIGGHHMCRRQRFAPEGEVSVEFAGSFDGRFYHRGGLRQHGG
jgi:3',5'-cyclic AMP phosphodiesterase CpdA